MALIRKKGASTLLRSFFAAGLAVCVGSSCSPRVDWILSLEELDADLAIPLTLRADGSFVQSAAPILLDGKEATQIEVPRGARVVFVLLRRAQLFDISPRFDPTREGELTVADPPAPSCIEGELDSVRRMLLAQMPADVSLAVAELGEVGRLVLADPGSLVGVRSAVLAIPVDDLVCGAGPSGRFGPYAGELSPIHVGLDLDGVAIQPGDLRFQAVHRLADDTLVVAGGHRTLYLLHPTEPYSGAPGSWVRFEADGPETLSVLAVDEDPRRAAPNLALVYAGLSANDFSSSRVEELRITSLGIERIETSTVVRGRKITSMLVDPATGRLLVAATPPLLLTRLPGEAFSSAPLPGEGTGGDPVLALTGLADQPFALLSATTHDLLFGDATATIWTPVPTTGIEAGVRLRSLNYIRDGEGAELWLGLGNGRIYRRPPGADSWDRQPLRLPASFPCSIAVTSCGWSQIGSTIRGLFPVAAPIPYLIVTAADCGAVLSVRRDLRCATFLSVAEGAADLRAVHQNARWLTLVDTSGAIYQLDLTR